MALKLKRIEIKNYGNLKSIVLDDLSDLNILIGPNNCGKTHILRAIELLNFALTARGVESKERYLKESGRGRIEIHFQFDNFAIALKESEHKVLHSEIESIKEISDEQERIEHIDRVTRELEKRPVLMCLEERLTRYRDKSLENYVIEVLPDYRMDEFKNALKYIDPKIIDIGKFLNRLQLGRSYEETILCTVDEQGSGVRSLICLVVDILAQKDEKDIILIDEPELGLHPSAKQWLLEWLLELSKEKQIFVATHDPAFVNPLVIRKGNVTVYMYSLIDETFKKVDLTKAKENPNVFAGFMPHVSSLKEFHLYVEGTTDVYVFQAMLQKFLQNEIPDRWFEVYNKVGIYHLGGSNYSLFLYTIPLIPRSIVIFDGNLRDKIISAINRLNRHEGCKRWFPEFKLCKSLDELRDILDREDKICPVYCLEKDDIKDYFNIKDKKSDVIAKVAWSLKPEKIPDEFHKLFKILFSDYISPKPRVIETSVVEDSLDTLSSYHLKLKIMSGNWVRSTDGLIQDKPNTFCNTVLITDFKLKDGIVEVEANSLDGIGGQHIIWRCDEDRKNFYMFGSVNLGSPTRYAHVQLWKDGIAKRDLIIWGINELPKLEPNRFHKYKVLFRDNEFKFYIDDKKVGELRDDTIREEGYVGLHCGSKTIFRNLKVWKLY